MAPKLGKQHMGIMTPPNVATFVELMKSQGFAPCTCNRALVLLRYGFDLALQWKVHGFKNYPVQEIENLRDENRIE